MFFNFWGYTDILESVLRCLLGGGESVGSRDNGIVGDQFGAPTEIDIHGGFEFFDAVKFN
ncbi:MAG: hypothetical protein KUA37_07490 [Desulfomicrobium sp.]|nr:hypothetical protein [Pseudomonadota bacterium]MBU4572579.1 hypothetical protein [Pseudomonadota bacterium]MBV1711833.1 hypothetical protein [Desulfomicrobium sp.]MBV1719105.1 hypothetical protein [Desulfomicrobium sp.]